MTDWHELSWDERRFMILEALTKVRSELTVNAPTRVVADRIARLTGFPSEEVGKVLVRSFAKPPHATPGPRFVRYGKAMQRWEWTPIESSGQVPPDLIA